MKQVIEEIITLELDMKEVREAMMQYAFSKGWINKDHTIIHIEVVDVKTILTFTKTIL